MTKQSRSAKECADAVSSLFSSVFHTLESWRDTIALLGPVVRPAELDARVEALVIPALNLPHPTLLGAGFMAAPEFVRGRPVHFAWWLGPLESNPLLGRTTAASRLDLDVRVYTEYLHDLRQLEWYSVPESTQQRHVTGPYVDHLCTCDYLFTLTVPVRVLTRMIGVVGADVSVRRLEAAVLPLFLAAEHPLALVNALNRVVISTEPTVQVGQLASPNARALACVGWPFRVLIDPGRPSRL